MPRTATATEYVYLDCAECGQGIAEPFGRYTGPRAFVHGHSGRRCRLMVWPDPHGEDHKMWRIPHHVSIEGAERSAIRFAHRHGWGIDRRLGHSALATAA